MQKTIKSWVAGLAALCLLLLGAAALPLYGQETTSISGTVLDEEEQPLTGATIRVEGTTRGTITDEKGDFSLRVSKGNTIEILYMGYITQTFRIDGRRTKFIVQLVEDENLLDDVVVIGYGSVRKQDLTGSVTNVKMNDIENAHVLSIDNALQGRIAGADFMSTSGAPGATTSVRIRGTRSITASNEPLYVVDGIIDAIHDLNDLNADDIASISVLKDASSVAIYGSRGSNGVIIITTKKGSGRSGKPNISFKADLGVAHLPKGLDLMNATEFQIFRNDMAYFGNDENHPDVGTDTPLSGNAYKNPLGAGEGTDWIKQVTRTAITQNYALSMTGTEGKHTYYTSFSYNDTQGIIKDSGQQRFTGRISLDRELFPWLKVGYSGQYTWRHNDQNKVTIGGTSWSTGAMYLNPLMKPQDTVNELYYGGGLINTPAALIDLNTHYLERHTSNHNFTATLTPIKGLEIKSTFGYYLYQRHTYRYLPGSLPAKAENEGGQAYRYEWDEHSLSSENTATYKFKTGKNSFEAMAGLSAYSFTSHDLEVSGKGYMDDEVMWNNMNAVLDKETYEVSTALSEKSKFSFFGRLNYNYDSRFYLTATIRRDGASNFAENNKYATFPSAAFKWNISNEPWINAPWLDELALRLSAGTSGNDAISAYRSHATLSSTTTGYLFDGSQPVAFYRSRLDSPNLKWEKTTSYNIGIDFSAFKGRVSITAEAYKAKTDDLLLSVQVPTQVGYSSKFVNIGKTSNRGVELTVETRNIEKKDFSWTTSFTVSHNDQMVDDIGGEEYVSALNAPGNNPYMMYGYVAGYPLNALWGFKYGGVWKSDEERARNSVTHTYASPASTGNGVARFYDINHDGSLSREDLVYQGNADPYIYGGIQNTFYFWKNLKLGVYFAYNLGGKIYNYSEIYMAGSRFTNQYRYMLDSWHPERNPLSDIPRAAGTSDAAMPSDFMIHDASFVRLKNVSISYTFDLQKKSRFFRDLTLSCVGDNLYLWKNYNGFDPDVSSEGTSSTLRRVDLGAYPKARTVTFSIQLRY